MKPPVEKRMRWILRTTFSIPASARIDGESKSSESLSPWNVRSGRKFSLTDAFAAGHSEMKNGGILG